MISCTPDSGHAACTGAPKPAYRAAAAVQRFVGRRPFLAQLGGAAEDGMQMQYVLAFGAEGAGPPPVAADAEASGAEVLVVWSLSANGSTARVTGRGDSAFCAGDSLWSGRDADCFGRCRQTAGCRGFVTWSSGNASAKINCRAKVNCQLTGSRCLVPRPVAGCGVRDVRRPPNATCGADPITSGGGAPYAGDACKRAVAHTVVLNAKPDKVVFALPSTARYRCYEAFDVLGAAVAGGAVCAGSDGRVAVEATEAPVYLVGKKWRKNEH